MTMIYARIADKTVAEEYFNVTEKVESLSGQPRQLPRDDEGSEMRKLRGEMHLRMFGNGHCARPVQTDCHFESICESCAFFVTTIEFRPTLQAQRDDAHNKGQIVRQKIFDRLLERLDHEGSASASDRITRISTTTGTPISPSACTPPPSSTTAWQQPWPPTGQPPWPTPEQPPLSASPARPHPRSFSCPTPPESTHHHYSRNQPRNSHWPPPP